MRIWYLRKFKKNCKTGRQDFYFILFFIFLFFFLFGFYSPFKEISLTSSRSFIKGGQNPENPGKNHLTIRKQNLAFPRDLRDSGERPNVLRVNSPIHKATGAHEDRG